jgi:CheY-like chemotaxis protein
MQMAQIAPAAKLVVVIDDDPAILEGMSGLLQSWGYRVVAAATEELALAKLAGHGQRPDLIICDFHLAGGKIGTQAIERLRDAFEIPALLITGGIAPDRPHVARASRYELLRKPVDATALQTMLSRALARKDVADAGS